MSITSKPKTYHITTFGCQMNVSDSERVSAVAESLGYIPSEDINNADLIVINSCSIRQKAEDRVIGMGKKISNYKSSNSELKVILTGCMAKRDPRGQDELKGELSDEKYEAHLKKLMPWLDNVIEIKDIYKMGEKLGFDQKVDIEEYLSVKPKISKKFSHFIPISTGCNKFCTFCIVPFSRGREIYRPFNEILDEIKSSIDMGAKEITLVGQNVNSWRGWKENNVTEKKYIESVDPHRLLKKDMPENMLNFADLLDAIGSYLDSHDQKVWLRFTSSHPYDIDEKLIDVVKNHKSLANQFHFALQSGSDKVLKRMNRHYTADDFTNKCLMIRDKIPGVGISTDIIVGFCGETEEEFQDTVNIMQNLKFDQAFISEYSNRKGTVASKVYKDNVTNEEKSDRKKRLDIVIEEGNAERNKKLINTNLEVLIYKKNKNGYVGRTESSKDVLISFDNDIKIGQFYNVLITEASSWSLTGKII